MQPLNIGRYEIQHEVGRGGMATVYLARDPRFDREVAVKVLPRQFTQDLTFGPRFEREARTMATVEHPAIVPVYDFGEEDDQPYLVMRYMRGGSLANRMSGDPMEPNAALRVLSRVAPAVDAAHDHGFIHRDIKPGNLLFDQRDDAFLSDFGLARLIAPTTSISGNIVLGTPAYMSPEQARGTEMLTPLSDTYSLGVLAYEMLTGRVPFVAQDPFSAMRMHIQDEPPAPSTLNPALDAGVEAVLLRALSKSPEARYPTATGLVAALAAALRVPLPGLPPDAAAGPLETLPANFGVAHVQDSLAHVTATPDDSGRFFPAPEDTADTAPPPAGPRRDAAGPLEVGTPLVTYGAPVPPPPVGPPRRWRTAGWFGSFGVAAAVAVVAGLTFWPGGDDDSSPPAAGVVATTTPTATFTAPPTATPTPRLGTTPPATTGTPTQTPTPKPTSGGGGSGPLAPTATWTPTATRTFTPTWTPTSTPTWTPTPTPTPTPIPQPSYRLNVTLDKTSYQPGDPAAFCYTISPEVSFNFRFYKSQDGGPKGLLINWIDDGRGDCVYATMGTAGSREYTFEAWTTDGESLLSRRILHTQVGPGGTTFIWSE